MATWHGEPYPGYFNDAVNNTNFLTEIFTIDNKWLPGHENEDIFAKFNSEVLTVIHEEKRFPTKEELAKIKTDTLKPEFKFDFSSFSILDSVVERNYDNEYQNFTFDLGGTSPATGNTTVTTSLNGISWKDFIESAELENTSYRASALASTKGITEKTLNHRLI